MTTRDDQKLEGYLDRLDKALGQISISQRADIITEIRSHILDAMESQGGRGLDAALSDMGDPEAVANRYLLERGMKPIRHARHSTAKWFAIGTLGTVGILCVFTLALFVFFSPLVQVNEKSGRVLILGGLIDIEEEGGAPADDFEKIARNLKRSDFQFPKAGHGAGTTFAGASWSVPLKASGLIAERLVLSYQEGELTVLAGEAAADAIEFKCRSVRTAGKGSVEEMTARDGNNVKIEAATLAGCTVSVPNGVSVAIQALNGSVAAKEIAEDMEIGVVNGTITFQERSGVAYSYDLSIVNGSTHGFEAGRREAAGAKKVKISVVNGSIKKA